MENKTTGRLKSLDKQCCANCDTLYTGNYCPNCGQSNKTLNKPFRFIVSDFASNIFAFDTRLWNTISTIFVKPGKIAQDIMAGKRERYMPPFRLYVFVSFIFFLMLNYSTPSGPESDALSNAFNVNLLYDNDTAKDSLEVALTEADSVRLEKVDTAIMQPLDGNFDIDFKDVFAHPKRYYSQFLRWVSTAMFFLLPMYGFLLWLFFRKTQTHYFGHLILAINQHVFTFLLFIILMGVDFILPENESSIGTWIFLSIPIYYFFGAYRLYQRKWSTTLMRLAVIGMVYGMLTITALVFIMGITLLE